MTIKKILPFFLAMGLTTFFIGCATDDEDTKTSGTDLTTQNTSCLTGEWSRVSSEDSDEETTTINFKSDGTFIKTVSEPDSDAETDKDEMDYKYTTGIWSVSSSQVSMVSKQWGFSDEDMDAAKTDHDDQDVPDKEYWSKKVYTSAACSGNNMSLKVLGTTNGNSTSDLTGKWGDIDKDFLYGPKMKDSSFETNKKEYMEINIGSDCDGEPANCNYRIVETQLYYDDKWNDDPQYNDMMDESWKSTKVTNEFGLCSFEKDKPADNNVRMKVKLNDCTSSMMTMVSTYYIFDGNLGIDAYTKAD